MTCPVCISQGVKCDERYCPIAGPGAPLSRQCRLCWLKTKRSSQNVITQPSAKSKLPCIHLGESTGDLVVCDSCPRGAKLKVYQCEVHGKCVLDRQSGNIACCKLCNEYEPVTNIRSDFSEKKDSRSDESAKVSNKVSNEMKPSALKEINAVRGVLKWSYGVTTVLSRRGNLLDRTLRSLASGGFAFPHLFVDGDDDAKSWREQYHLNVTCRQPKVGTAGNWALSLYELYYRQPDADRFAIFQDDLIVCKNFRQYLERCPYPSSGYLNCFTFPSNQNLAKGRTGWYRSNQFGRGAVALVFNRDVTMRLLSAWHMVERVQDKQRGHKAIDGGIVDSLKPLGIKEYVHNPSLTYHTGQVSSMENPPHAQTNSFVGESFDALTMKPQLHEV
jgi:hypothetical protein